MPDADNALPPDASIVARLLAGDADCFTAVVDAWSPGLRRFAAALLPCCGGTEAGAPDADTVVKSAWLAALRGLAEFAGTVSLKVWVYRHALNALPMPPVFSVCPEDSAPVLDEDRFRPPDAALYPGGWQEGQMPVRWPGSLAADAAAPSLLLDTLAFLPTRLRAVLLLRDAEGCHPEEVSWLLGIDVADQRILLHSARALLRNAIDDHYAKLGGGEVSHRGLQ